MIYKTAIITGATKGVGKEIAKQLYQKDYNLALIGRDFSKRFPLKEGNNFGKDIHLYECDLISYNNIIKLCDKIKNDFPSIDVLINNAGFNTKKACIEDYSIKEYNDIIDLNLKAPYMMVHELIPEMKKQKKGTIINVIAAMANLCKEKWGPYSSAKAGLLAFSKVLSKECASHNIKVTSLIPGGINTGFRNEERPEYMSPESVAKVIIQILESPSDLVQHEIIIKPLNENL